MELLSTYPPSVIDRAADPATGIPARIEFLNLASIRKLLEGWAEEYEETRQRIERANRKELPLPERDPAMEARINEGFRKLSEQLKRGLQ